jgi:hypothetical protein
MACAQDRPLPARLNADRLRVCCPYRKPYYRHGGWHEEYCTGWVALVVPSEDGKNRRVLYPRPGWKQDEDGIVREIAYSRKRRKQGQEEKYRSMPPYAAAWSVSTGEKVCSARRIRFPAWALCTHCDRPMELVPAVLDVVSGTYLHFCGD